MRRCDNNKCDWICFIASYPPRECGIATFTRDIATSINKLENKNFTSKIIAMNENGSSVYNYNPNVIFQIDETDMKSYYQAADIINNSKKIKLVNIQHEFGIFGGEFGNYIIPFLEQIKKPIITTFHSVVDNPVPEKERVVKEIAKNSDAVIVIVNKAKEILMKHYGIDKNKIFVIPHGIHHVDFVKPNKVKDPFNKPYLKTGFLLSTFGLLEERKKIEYVIDALPKVLEKHPNILYAIIGETHPKSRLKSGEEYRNKLKEKVKKLGLNENVKFYNKYLDLKEVLQCLQATDIHITPYTDSKQISSGTLAYALGCGRVCISTPFYYAAEVLDKKRGILVNYENSEDITNAIMKVLNDPKLKESMEKKAYDYTRFMIWSNVAENYLKTFNKFI